MRKFKTADDNLCDVILQMLTICATAYLSSLKAVEGKICNGEDNIPFNYHGGYLILKWTNKCWIKLLIHIKAS